MTIKEAQQDILPRIQKVMPGVINTICVLVQTDWDKCIEWLEYKKKLVHFQNHFENCFPGFFDRYSKDTLLSNIGFNTTGIEPLLDRIEKYLSNNK